MQSLPLGGDFRRGWRWDHQSFGHCGRLRGTDPRTGQISCHRRRTGPVDDGYFDPAVGSVGDVIVETVQHARQHAPQWSSVRSADGLIERNRRAVSNRECGFQRGKNLSQRCIAGLKVNERAVSVNADRGAKRGRARR